MYLYRDFGNGNYEAIFVTGTIYRATSLPDLIKATTALIKKFENNVVASSSNSSFSSGRLIVGCAKELPDLSKFNAAQVIADTSGNYLIQFQNAKDAVSCADHLKSLSYIDFVEPDMVTKLNVSSFTSASNALSWGVSATNADDYARNLKERGFNSNVTVAVMDSGIDSTHSFLRGRVLSNGYDFVDSDRTPQDENGHGTHVAGTIVDCTPNLNINILPIRVIDDGGYGDLYVAGQGILYAAEQGANVVNMSLTWGTQGSYNEEKHGYLDKCISDVISKNVTVVVAAGNKYDDTEFYCPAHNQGCITVAAVDQAKRRADFSNYGQSIDIAAPGVDITSCYPGESYVSWPGTSMASPHVAAAAALLLYENNALSPSQIEMRLKNAATDLGNPGWDQYYGAGFLNLEDFVRNEPIRPMEYTVTFNPNGGSVSTITKRVTNGETYGALPTPTWSNHSFDGWYTSASGGTRITSSSTVNLSGNQTLYAHWTSSPVTYTVTFNPNGGSVNTTTKRVTNGETYGALPTPTWSNHSFDGWYTSANGGTRITSSSTVNLSANQTLYAHWTSSPVTYTVTFDPNGGSVDTRSKRVTNGETYGILPTPTWSNHSFDGWYTSANGGTRITSSSTVNLDGNQTLYAHWEYTAVLTLNHSDVTIYSTDHGHIAVGSSDPLNWSTIIINQGESAKVSYSLYYSYADVPGLQLKAYLDGRELSPSEVIWSQSQRGGYANVDSNGYVSSDTNAGFNSGRLVAEMNQVITATLKNNPSISASANITLVYDGRFEFSTADTNIATVDQDGIVYGRNPGNTTLTMRSSVTGKSATCTVSVGGVTSRDVDLGYMQNGQFYSLNSYGGPDYILTGNRLDYRLKIPWDDELLAGSKLEVSIVTDTYSKDSHTVSWDDNFARIDREGIYYSLSSILSQYSGKVLVYYQISLADGQILSRMNEGSRDCFFLNLT